LIGLANPEATDEVLLRVLERDAGLDFDRVMDSLDELQRRGAAVYCERGLWRPSQCACRRCKATPQVGQRVVFDGRMRWFCWTCATPDEQYRAES
jgi:hypothetical protein